MGVLKLKFSIYNGLGVVVLEWEKRGIDVILMVPLMPIQNSQIDKYLFYDV